MAPGSETSRSNRGLKLVPGMGEGAAERSLRTGLLIIIAVVLLGWALRALTPVVVPLVAAILAALVVMPVRDWVRARVPDRFRWLGPAAAMTLIVVILAVFFGGVWMAAQQVLSEVPRPSGQLAGVLDGGAQEEEQFQTQPRTVAEGAQLGAQEGSAPGGAAEGAEAADRSGAPGAGESAAGGTGGEGAEGNALPMGSPGEVLRTLGDRALGAAGGIAAAIVNSALIFVAGLVLVFFLTLLLLVESSDWRRKVQAVTQPHTEWQLTQSADVIGGKVRRYLVVRTILGLVTAALYALWLWIFGVGLVLVWAVLTFLLNFLPTIGSLIAGLLPVIYALLTQSWSTALAVGVGLLIIEQVMGNYVDPRLQGKNVALSPLVVLVALVFWGWAWGIAGAFLAVPMTASFVVLAAHVPRLRPWALLLTNRTRMEGLDDAAGLG